MRDSARIMREHEAQDPSQREVCRGFVQLVDKIIVYVQNDIQLVRVVG
jgi:hypothetical protein